MNGGRDERDYQKYQKLKRNFKDLREVSRDEFELDQKIRKI